MGQLRDEGKGISVTLAYFLQLKKITIKSFPRHQYCVYVHCIRGDRHVLALSRLYECMSIEKPHRLSN